MLLNALRQTDCLCLQQISWFLNSDHEMAKYPLTQTLVSSKFSHGLMETTRLKLDTVEIVTSAGQKLLIFFLWYTEKHTIMKKHKYN